MTPTPPTVAAGGGSRSDRPLLVAQPLPPDAPQTAATMRREGFHRTGAGLRCEVSIYDHPHGAPYAQYVDEATGDHLCRDHAYERAMDRRVGRS